MCHGSIDKRQSRIMGLFKKRVDAVNPAMLVSSLQCLDAFCNDSVINSGVLVELNHSLSNIRQYMRAAGVEQYTHKNIIFVLTDEEIKLRISTSSLNQGLLQ